MKTMRIVAGEADPQALPGRYNRPTLNDGHRQPHPLEVAENGSCTVSGADAVAAFPSSRTLTVMDGGAPRCIITVLANPRS